MPSEHPSKPARFLSPLRYPGAKRKLAPYIAALIRDNGLHPKLFVEPFAGGASVALHLLTENLVEKVGLGDLDPLVASFWKVTFWDTAWLQSAFEELEPSLELWQRFKTSRPTTDRDRALKCLFLNRTSYGGIIAEHVGPLGGWDQNSAYKIDCRYSADTTRYRLYMASLFRDRVAFVDEADWRDTIQKSQGCGYGQNEIYFYCDPPYDLKCKPIYNHTFQPLDHEDLRSALTALSSPWAVSYDTDSATADRYPAAGTKAWEVERAPGVNEHLIFAIKQGSSSTIENISDLPTKN